MGVHGTYNQVEINIKVK